MKPLIKVLLLLFALPALGADPEVRIETRLSPAGEATVGSTIDLQVDLLVDTWFTDAPVLPAFDLPGAVVTPPDGQAVHLNETRDGKPFFGMRFTYRITPQQAQRFVIPALDIKVLPGGAPPVQGTGLVTLQSQPLSFEARLPPGFAAGSHVLVASNVTFNQNILHSHEPLRVGDSITRQLSLRADDAQAMLIPPPRIDEIDGLKRYVQTPRVRSLDDGRGRISGGSRDDTVSYVIERPGNYTLPGIALEWWDAGAGAKRTASVPDVAFTAVAAPAYQSPFSVTEDLRALGHDAQLHIARHWVVLAVLALVLMLAAVFIKPRLPELLARWRHWRAARHQAWLDSPEYAWRQARRQLASEPPQLRGLYQWIRRIDGSTSFRQYAQRAPGLQTEPVMALLESLYGAKKSKRPDLDELLATLHQEARAQRRFLPAGTGLKLLNPPDRAG